MLWRVLLSARDIGRLRDIATVLVRHGFGDIVQRSGLARALARMGHRLYPRMPLPAQPLSAAARTRRVLEELGPTFIKLGQLLSSRVDLLDAEWIAELSRLQDQAPTVPLDAIRAQLIEDLGAAPERLFARFDTEPLAAASVAQVHRARTPAGAEVVVKVRRPGIVSVVEADLRWLTRLAAWAEQDDPAWRALQAQALVRQFAQSIRREMDFTHEASQAQRFAQAFAGYRDGLDDQAQPIVIPAVHWQWCRERVCVQDHIDGLPGRRWPDLEAQGLDRRLLARRGARAVLKTIVEDGCFHADPHPGNLFYLPGNRIAFIDFGMVGRLSPQRREQITDLLLGLAQQDSAAVTAVLLDWTRDGGESLETLGGDIDAFIDRYRGRPLKDLPLGRMLSEAVAVLREHRLTLPSDLALLVKAFVTLEGMGRELDPDFQIAQEALPLLREAVARRYRPQALLQRWTQWLGRSAHGLAALPGDLMRLVRQAGRGRLEVRIEIHSLRRLGNQIDRAANRLAVSLVIAALVVGSSIVLTVPGGPLWLGLPVFGLLGFLGASAGGLWLLLSIWRSSRDDRDDSDPPPPWH